jgi:hypothetical protein
MNEPIERVVILGGGTAGWMTAAYLAKALKADIDITVIEASSIPKIGVGEATVPNLQRVFFDRIGLCEDEWMRHCNASLKGAVKFINWRAPAGDGSSHHFYHPFGLLPQCEGVPLSHYWLSRRLAGDTTPYDYACLKEPPALDAKLSLRHLNGRPATRYAWHFDAHLVADYLRRLSVEDFGVHHIVDELHAVDQDEKGFITSLRTKSGHRIAGDLFVDCSGFRGLLINKTLEEPFIDMSDHLLCDSAVAAAIPHDDERLGIEPYTSAIAMRNGWTWKIPLLGRFGSGYVFSSRFCSVDEAARDFCRLWNVAEGTIPLNTMRFRVGRNRNAWVKNCVSIGLSSCFLEPLESTGIYFIYASIYQLARHFPDKEFDPALIRHFNREIEYMFDDSRDFIQAHYVLSPRDDTPFWRANTHELTMSSGIREKIETYGAGIPLDTLTNSEDVYYDNFEVEFRNFWTNHSYYSIFSGLGVLPRKPLSALLYRPDLRRKAEPIFADVRAQQHEMVHTLPTLYDYLRHLHHGEADALHHYARAEP